MLKMFPSEIRSQATTTEKEKVFWNFKQRGKNLFVCFLLLGLT
jgi:hypothetical protein